MLFFLSHSYTSNTIDSVDKQGVLRSKILCVTFIDFTVQYNTTYFCERIVKGFTYCERIVIVCLFNT
jgi:hypothetical protein